MEVVNANKHLSVLKKKSVLSTGFQSLKPNCYFLNFKFRRSGSHGKKGTILFLGSINVLVSVISTKLYFVEIS